MYDCNNCEECPEKEICPIKNMMDQGKNRLPEIIVFGSDIPLDFIKDSFSGLFFAGGFSKPKKQFGEIDIEDFKTWN